MAPLRSRITTHGRNAAGASEAWFMVVPVEAIGLAIGLYAIRTRSAAERRKLDSPIWHSAMFLLLLSICSNMRF